MSLAIGDAVFRAPASPPRGRRPGRVRHELVRVARWATACLATLFGVAAVVAQPGQGGEAVAPPAPQPQTALVQFPLPGDLDSWQVPAQVAAATCPGLPADVLVAIAQVESVLGSEAQPSSAGAIGPMQFLPATWAAYGVDGDGDGHADVLNSMDALHGAARLLCAHGGGDPARLGSALWNYNHSERYVRQVLGMAWVNRSAA